MRINYNKLINYYEKIVNADKFSAVLLRIGFNKISNGKFCDVFRYKDHPIVIKVVVRGSQALPTIKKTDKKLSQVFVGYKNLSLDSVVGVQDFVEEYLSLSDPILKREVKLLTKLRRKYDIHIGNIGVFNGKPVVFDF